LAKEESEDKSKGQLTAASPASSLARKSWEANKGSEELTDLPVTVKTPEVLLTQQSHEVLPDSLEAGVASLGGTRRKVNVDSITLNELSEPPDSLRLDEDVTEPEEDVQPDSLSFDEDTFERRPVKEQGEDDDEFFDSIGQDGNLATSSGGGGGSGGGQRRKLIIPYADSYSSNNTSAFTSEESLTEGKGRKGGGSSFPRDIRDLTLAVDQSLSANNSAEDGSIPTAALLPAKRPLSASHQLLEPLETHHNRRPGLPPTQNRLLPAAPNRLHMASSAVIKSKVSHASNPDLRRGSSGAISPPSTAAAMSGSPMALRPASSASTVNLAAAAAIRYPTFSRPPPPPSPSVVGSSSSSSSSAPHPSHQVGPSLVRMATEKMKMKFLGWS